MPLFFSICYPAAHFDRTSFIYCLYHDSLLESLFVTLRRLRAGLINSEHHRLAAPRRRNKQTCCSFTPYFAHPLNCDHISCSHHRRSSPAAPQQLHHAAQLNSCSLSDVNLSPADLWATRPSRRKMLTSAHLLRRTACMHLVTRPSFRKPGLLVVLYYCTHSITFLSCMRKNGMNKEME